MGLLNFLKKKQSDLPMAGEPQGPPMDQALLNDLPPIDMTNIEGSSMEKMPTKETLTSDGTSQRQISFNQPMLDFSMPPSDDEDKEAPTDNQELPNIDGSALQPPSSPQGFSSQSLQNFNAPGNTQGIQKNLELSEDELNQLFISDGWKEPDWNTYDPYVDEKIDEPSPEDFKGEDLPKFEDTFKGIAPSIPTAASNALPAFEERSDDDSDKPATVMPFSMEPQKQVDLQDLKDLEGVDTLDEPEVPQSFSSPQSSDEPQPEQSDDIIVEPDEPFPERPQSAVRPIELYIRGKAYGKVFSELNLMSKTLSKMDAQTGTYEEMVKREEPLLASAKEQMEYLYRRMSLIDKKIFMQ